MKQFLVNYYSSPAAMEKMANSTPEEMQAGMKPWMDWKDEMGENLIDMGTPLMPAQVVGSDDAAVAKASGYSIIQAADINSAKTMLAEHPHLKWDSDSSIEVSECMPM
ncbi:MAG: hypothetical protein JKY22_00035 [Flavobacteriaceae bacterium]|nr:hypothetical protein [Flavobacteriaceae bacterium]